MKQNDYNPQTYPPQIATIPFPVPIIDGSAIEAIGNQAIAFEKAKSIKRQSISRYEVLEKKNTKESYLFIYENDQVKSSVLFFNGHIKNVVFIKYPDYLGWDKYYILIIESACDTMYIPIPQKNWGTRKMLHHLNEFGIHFGVKIKPIEIVQILIDHLSAQMINQKWAEIDPFPGWFFGENNPQYRTSERWLFPELPSFTIQKTLGQNPDKDCLSNGTPVVFDYLSALTSPGNRLLLLSILLYSVTYQIFKKYMGCNQDKVIIFKCEDDRIKAFIKLFYNIYSKGNEEFLSLTCPHQILKKVLMISKDEPIIIDGDTTGSKKQKEENIEMIINYIKGNAISHISAGAPIIICCKGLITGFPLSEAMVIELNMDDFDIPLLYKALTIPSVTATFVSGIIYKIEADFHWFIKGSHALLETQEPDLPTIFSLLSKFVHICLDEEKIDYKNFFSQEHLESLLFQARENLDALGVGDMIINELIKAVDNKIIHLKKHLIPVEEDTFDSILFYSSELVFVQECILSKYILPKIASPDMPILHLISALKDQGYLAYYSGDSEKTYSQGYRKKIRIRYINGVFKNIPVICIYRKAFDFHMDYDLFEIGEDEYERS